MQANATNVLGLSNQSQEVYLEGRKRMFSLPKPPRIHVRKYPRSILDKSLSRYIEFITADTHRATTLQ